MLFVTLKVYFIALLTSLAGMLWGLDTGGFRKISIRAVLDP